MSLEIADESTSIRPWSLQRRIIAASLSIIVGAGIFGLAYLGMHTSHGIGAFNQPILDWMTHHRQADATRVANLIALVADPKILAGLIGIIGIIWALATRKLWRPFLLIGSMAATAIIAMALKGIFHNARPAHEFMVKPFETGYSFPSGHAIAITVAVLVLGYLICSRRTSGGRIFSWIILSIVSIVCVACSRLYLGYHWLTDVTASVGLGFIILAVIIAIDVIFVARFKNLE